ncbi:CBS domain-containing protein [Pseudonocardia bannensis]|uniref:CBS domain-containing protein n=1 Tax=Pseudonocardia bannensis TaxID=630973 RepID=A0A848DSE2_9PSEU|nr:CBS domain-containing protein [Pseudonocardia bannensis]NMH95409.1 CBS domain-containing protein [Pseudonocardia bannensis]
MSTPPTRPAAAPESIGDDPPVSAVMTRRLVAIVPAAPLATALRLMAEAGVQHLPVIDGQRCLGVLTEADVVRCMAGWPGPSGAAAAMLVGELCRPAECVEIRSRRSGVARRMHASGADAVLVARQGRLQGIVTASDLIRSLAESAAAAEADEGEDRPDATGRERMRGAEPVDRGAAQEP